jgi:hypothetical protein
VAHTTELRNALRSIEWDLEDLDDTIQIVEKNPAKFRIDAGELAARKGFIALTRDEVEKMKAAMTVNSETPGAIDAGVSHLSHPTDQKIYNKVILSEKRHFDMVWFPIIECGIG